MLTFPWRKVNRNAYKYQCRPFDTVLPPPAAIRPETPKPYRKNLLTNPQNHGTITQHSRGAHPYRGVEQLEARRAHNPEVVGSSPASATIKTTAFAVVFLCFCNFLLGFKESKITGANRKSHLFARNKAENACQYR